MFDTAAQGYGEPNDVQSYAPGRLLVTSNGGHLLLLSTAYPEMPTLNRDWRPSGTRRYPRACRGGYPYTGPDGNPASIDLAVAGLRDGRLVTLDVTDPFNPHLLGTAVDASGQTVSTWVSDLSLNKEAGLAFITTFSSIQVFDIKDPTAPRLLTTITALPEENGNLVPIGSIPALVEEGGWVYLGSEAQGMRVIDLDPHTLKIVPQPIALAGRLVAPAKADVLLGAEIRPDTGFRARSATLRVYEDDQLLWETPQPVPMNVQTSVLFPAKSKGFTFDAHKRYIVGIRLVNVDGAVFEMPQKDRVPLPLSWPVLFTDYNHDRKIDQTDIDRAVKGDSFYFWINDDDDEGEEGADGNMPGKKRTLSFKLDFENDVIDGVRDLIDFFPVTLDVKVMNDLYPVGTYRYRLKSPGENLNMVLPQTTRDHAGDYLTDVTTARAAAERLVKMLTKSGELPVTIGEALGTSMQQQLDQSIREAGIDGAEPLILLEGRKAGKEPLTLDVLDSTGKVVFTSSLNLSLDGVEQMFRHVNLVPTIGNPNAPPVETGKIGEHAAEGGEANRYSSADFANPAHFSGFDAELNDHYFVMVHGANVDGQAARAWHSEMFKRLYWSGSKTKFVGVTWYSDEGSNGNYQENVVNAFRTAAQFGQNIAKATHNAPVTIMAHSLGNMVVSSYLNDYYRLHPLNVTDYFMFNAAVPLESYLGDYQGYAEGKLNDPDAPKIFSSDNSMVPSEWFGYDKQLGASEWHQLFGTDDPRRKLTWRNRFADLPTGINYYSFYSTGEDVLATYAGETPDISDLGRHSWVLQEKWKGCDLLLGSTDLMGWGFNQNNYQSTVAVDGGLPENHPWQPSIANSLIRDDQLLSEPFFRKPTAGQPGSQLFESTVDPEYVDSVRDELLALALPSLSLAAGGWQGGDVITNGFIKEYRKIDMNDPLKKNGWPESRGLDSNWKHSDIKDVGFVFSKEILKIIVEDGGL